MFQIIHKFFLCLCAIACAGQMTPVQAQQDRSYLKRDCDAGDRVACNNWGSALEHGNGAPQDKDAARDYYARACALGEPFSCTNVGLLMQDGRVGEADPVGADVWLRKGCFGGDPKSCAWVARLSRTIDALRDPAVNAEFSRKGCELGGSDSCVFWGIVLEDGAGAPQDKQAALNAYVKACDGQVKSGCYNAAFLLRSAQPSQFGADRLERSNAFAQRGCDLGSVSACNTLGVAYDVGRGIPKDPVKARDLFEQTCAQDSGLGCYNLGTMWSRGSGGPRDSAKAKVYFALGCEHGYTKSCAQK